MENQEYARLSETFLRIIVAIHRNFFRQMKLPLPINQFSVLKVLDNEGPMTGRDIGDLLAISKQQLTPILEKLEKCAYIRRRPIPSDRRFTEISLTAAGEKLISSFDEILRQRIERDLHNLSEVQVASLTKSTATIQKFLDHLASAPLSLDAPKP